MPRGIYSFILPHNKQPPPNRSENPLHFIDIVVIRCIEFLDKKLLTGQLESLRPLSLISSNRHCTGKASSDRYKKRYELDQDSVCSLRSVCLHEQFGSHNYPHVQHRMEASPESQYQFLARLGCFSAVAAVF